jgi:hypothetical protein
MATTHRNHLRWIKETEIPVKNSLTAKDSPLSLFNSLSHILFP